MHFRERSPVVKVDKPRLGKFATRCHAHFLIYEVITTPRPPRSLPCSIPMLRALEKKHYTSLNSSWFHFIGFLKEALHRLSSEGNPPLSSQERPPLSKVVRFKALFTRVYYRILPCGGHITSHPDTQEFGASQCRQSHSFQWRHSCCMDRGATPNSETYYRDVKDQHYLKAM